MSWNPSYSVNFRMNLKIHLTLTFIPVIRVSSIALRVSLVLSPPVRYRGSSKVWGCTYRIVLFSPYTRKHFSSVLPRTLFPFFVVIRFLTILKKKIFSGRCGPEAVAFIYFFSNIYKLNFIKLRGLSPQANYTDRATAAVGEVVPTFAGRGSYVVSATDSHGR
jgi:hypothetical protein